MALSPRTEPGTLYVGRVLHERLQPKRHRFVYRLFTMLLDIDRLPELNRQLKLFSVERANLFTFYNRDHGARDGSPLRPWAEAQLREAGIAETPARLLLLAMPRMFGYVFNPLSIYYAFDRHDHLFAIIYEVKNTFGEQHAYVLPVEPGDWGADAVRQHCAKNFYVSPFIEAKAGYSFRLNRPGERLAVLIHETDAAGPLLTAALTGRQRPMTDGQLLRLVLGHPLLTHKVIGAIHIEALRLWLKRIRLQPRQQAPLANLPGKQGDEA